MGFLRAQETPATLILTVTFGLRITRARHVLQTVQAYPLLAYKVAYVIKKYIMPRITLKDSY